MSHGMKHCISLSFMNCYSLSNMHAIAKQNITKAETLGMSGTDGYMRE